MLADESSEPATTPELAGAPDLLLRLRPVGVAAPDHGHELVEIDFSVAVGLKQPCWPRCMTGDTPVWDPHFIETLEGSFSAVSKPLIARNGAFCSIKFFRDLQDLHSFAPLQSQKFSKIHPFGFMMFDGLDKFGTTLGEKWATFGT